MNILISPYELKKKASGEIQAGTLIKVIEDRSFGVADLCPHPDLGDSDWRSEIAKEGPLFKRAVHLAKEDLSARKKNISLLLNQKIQNNFLITDYSRSDLNDKKYSENILKIKGDSRVEMLAGALNRVQQNIIFRIDFNAKLSAVEFEKFLSLLESQARDKIQYIEDPTVLQAHWKEWNLRIPLASDWQKTNNLEMAKYKIVKPAREEIPSDPSNCIFTSAMDHPVGVAHAMRLAQTQPAHVCGFSTLEMYELNTFSKYFLIDGAWLGFSELALSDSGIGMTAELNKLYWARPEEVVP